MKKILGLCLIGALLALALPAPAQSLVTGGVVPRVVSLGQLTTTNVDNQFTNYTLVNVETNLLLTASYQHALAVEVTSSNSVANTGVITNRFDLSTDGTLFTTTVPIAVNITNTGTTVARGVTIVPASAFDGCKAIRWTTIAGQNSSTNSCISYITVRLSLTP